MPGPFFRNSTLAGGPHMVNGTMANWTIPSHHMANTTVAKSNHSMPFNVTAFPPLRHHLMANDSQLPTTALAGSTTFMRTHATMTPTVSPILFHRPSDANGFLHTNMARAISSGQEPNQVILGPEPGTTATNGNKMTPDADILALSLLICMIALILAMFALALYVSGRLRRKREADGLTRRRYRKEFTKMPKVNDVEAAIKVPDLSLVKNPRGNYA